MADEEIRCSVCNAKRKGVNHLRIEVCRACAVFFRRANQNGTVLKCRTRTDECKLDRDSLWSCKKCRYVKIQQTFNQLLHRERHIRPGPSNALEWNYDPMSDRENVSFYLDELRPLNISPMLRKYRRCYNDLCRERLIIEFGTLENLPIDFMIEAEPAPTDSRNSFIRRFYDGIFNFLNAASEEFAVMMPEHKMKLCANFAKVWISFECSYRTQKYFPEHKNKTIATFGRYIDIKNFAIFYPGLSNHPFRDEATRMMQDVANKTYSVVRPAMTRLNLTDEEYIAITALLLWNISSSSVSDNLADVAAKNKKAVLHDLYKYYRSIGLEDYSARLGEIFVFLQLFEHQINECSRLLDTFKVLEVIDEETYNLTKIMS